MTESKIKYLMTISKLSKKEKQLRAAHIAKHMGYARASVKRAINNLEESQFISVNMYKIKLTEKGKTKTQQYTTQMQYIENALTKELNITKEDALENAIRLLGNLSDKSINNLYEKIRGKQ